VKGVSISDGKTIWQAKAFPQKAFDRTGAGDAFGSGFVAGLIRFQDPRFKIQESIRLAMANATGVVEKLGGNAGALTKNEFAKAKRFKKINLTKIIL